ncbi:MAG: hypothetical protein ACREP9_20390, partial [Candidatus Dormibacteraceae bacterium]
MPHIDSLLAEHVTLQCACVDRLYLNGYLPNLQVSGQLVSFLHYKGYPIPSPVAINKITKDFVQAVAAFAASQQIPTVQFKRDERKDDVVRPFFEKLLAEGRIEGVAVIGVAQERVSGFKAQKIMQKNFKTPWFNYSRASVYVNQYYFYILDADFGPGFIKISSYAPYAIKVCLNGHEWVKRQLEKAGLAYTPLDNGFLSVEDPGRLQTICDELSSVHLEDYFRAWIERLPFPLSAKDRSDGYRHHLSIMQMEISLTHVFRKPIQGREFFEQVIRENLDLGRPDRVQLVFNRRVTRATPGTFRTRVITRGVDPSLHVEYKHSHLKQYFKEGRALRTELTINDTRDFGFRKALHYFEDLRDLGHQANRRLL